MNPDSFRLDDAALARLAAGGESARVEFKERLSGNALQRIEEAVCAFANDLGGSREPGVVIVGFRDDGTPAGTAVTDELLRTLTDIRSNGHVLPPPMILVEKRLLAGAEVAVVTVAPSDSPPVSCRRRIQVRNGPRRSIATAQEERVLTERARYTNRPFDIRSVAGATVADLNRRQFEDEYLPAAVAPEVLEANERSYRQRLAAAKMIASVDDERPTVLGMLAVGIRTRDFFDGARVQFLRIDGKEFGDDIIDAATIGGTIPDMVKLLEDRIRSHNRTGVDFTSADTERRRELYPFAALQQLCRNALMHRSYEATNAPVQVTWFNDRIEIQSPGGPYGQVAMDTFGRPGVVDYRNPNLAEAMRNLGYVQRFGAGIGTAQRVLREAGHPEAEFEASQTHVLATVRAAGYSAGGAEVSAPVLTFFNNKGGVGKTSLVYHLAWMLSEQGKRILACDLDPQANLTASFMDDETLEPLLTGSPENGNATIHQCVQPLAEVGDLKQPVVHMVSDTLGVIPGDLALSSFEDLLSVEWLDAHDSSYLLQSFWVLTAFWQVMQMGAKEMQADMILVDVGPNLGAINRSALIATDYVIVPVVADVFSLQGLRNLASTLATWRKEWRRRRENWPSPDFPLPNGGMRPIGYILQQHGERQGRPVKAYGKWAARIPEAYARLMDGWEHRSIADSPESDPNCLARVRGYRSLVRMAQEARKPIFALKPADGAIGSHAAATVKAYGDFRELAGRIVERMERMESERQGGGTA